MYIYNPKLKLQTTMPFCEELAILQFNSVFILDVYVHAYIYVYIHMCTYLCICVCTYIHIHICIDMYLYVYQYTYIYTFIIYIYVSYIKLETPYICAYIRFFNGYGVALVSRIDKIIGLLCRI